jgi:CheY-like chemotaxis protein
MRPKSVILLVGQREAELALWRFLLDTRGYRVLTATTVPEAVDLLGRIDVRVAVVELEMELELGASPSLSVMNMLRKWGRGEVRTVLVAKTKRPGVVAHQAPDTLPHQADALLYAGPHLHTELVERLRVMCARKPGPKRACADAAAMVALAGKAVKYA